MPKLAKVNAERMVIDARRQLAVMLANPPNRVETARVVPTPSASLMVIDGRMLLVAKVANRTSRAVMVIVVPMVIALLKDVVPQDRMDVDRMVNRRAMAIVLPKVKVDEVRCRGSSNCSTAITTANSARTNSIDSKKSSPNWIATKTVS